MKRTLEILRVLFVDEGREVTAIIKNHVEALAIGEGSEGLLNTPSVFFLSLTLPGIDRDAGSSNSIR